MGKRSRALTLIELSAAGLALGTLLVAFSAGTSRNQELSRRMACSVNLKGIGAACKVYAQDNSGSWPVPPFDGRVVQEEGDGIDYAGFSPHDVCAAGNGGGVAYRRDRPSLSFDPGGSTMLSVTRAYWMLVRSGAVHLEQFICPSSSDVVDPTDDVESYYDFRCYENISYGYQVPFGPQDTRPREGMDNRQVIAADKGPFYECEGGPWWGNSHGEWLSLDDPPRDWRPYNSPNHGGRDNGEGQNCLSPDLGVAFERIPAVGIDHDNIYTLITYEWNSPESRNIIYGDAPCELSPPPYPGIGALGTSDSDYASTDSLIYP